MRSTVMNHDMVPSPVYRIYSLQFVIAYGVAKDAVA